ncbi:methyltransferase [Paenibacillus albiflavus]|uniref:Methyltransferase n=1 Tax=Paenibacillus albiflavus TaxID=2545760 RepID=A0A4R4EGU0_9BACL|nr:methyltransferase [Paenibacillus albiflavus]TCZ79306.1 methyltransferase [Paenibacillus albiflavus]
MKNIFRVFLLVLLSLCLLSACVDNKSEAKSIIFENAKNNFTLQLPHNWDGKYDVNETEDKITFVNKANKSSGGVLFEIRIWTKEKWSTEGEELAKIIHLSKIGEKGDIVFSFNTPTDIQYILEDDNKKQEYLTMSNDIEAIKASFSIKQD